MLNIPPSMRDEVHQLSDIVTVRDGTSVTPEAAVKASDGIRGLFAALISERRKSPGSDVVILWMTTVISDDGGNTQALSDEALSYRSLELAFAGHEAGAKLIN